MAGLVRKKEGPLIKLTLFTRDGRYQNFDVDVISICKASIYQYITIWTFSLNLCKCIKYPAFVLNFGDLNVPLILKTATLWTLLLHD